MRRLLFLVFALALFCPFAHANQSASGFCQAGAQVVVTSGLTSTTQVMGSFPQCLVTVNVHGGGLATIYSDNNNTPLANPFTATTGGQWQIYALNGHYDIILSGFPAGASPATVTISDVLLDDPAQQVTTQCAVAFSATPTFTANVCSIFSMTLTGNVTSSAVTGGATGQVITFSLTQGAGGPWTFAWPASFVNPPLLTPTAAKSEQASFALLADGNWHSLSVGESQVFDTAVNGNVLRVSGNGITGVTGTGSTVVLNGGSPTVANLTVTGGTSAAFAILNEVVVPEGTAPAGAASDEVCYGDPTLHALKCSYNNGTFFQIPQVITATSAAFATATTAGTCATPQVTAVTGATTGMAVVISPVSTPGVGAVWSAYVSSAGNVTINECAVATSAGGTIAFNIRVIP